MKIIMYLCMWLCVCVRASFWTLRENQLIITIKPNVFPSIFIFIAGLKMNPSLGTRTNLITLQCLIIKTQSMFATHYSSCFKKCKPRISKWHHVITDANCNSWGMSYFLDSFKQQNTGSNKQDELREKQSK